MVEKNALEESDGSKRTLVLSAACKYVYFYDAQYIQLQARSCECEVTVSF